MAATVAPPHLAGHHCITITPLPATHQQRQHHQSAATAAQPSSSFAPSPSPPQQHRATSVFTCTHHRSTSSGHHHAPPEEKRSCNHRESRCRHCIPRRRREDLKPRTISATTFNH
ncbi:hypothetical protein DEO72_LG10g2326 [Vigna unguiculata]|uniref:Uncharacterized protein n=1 Tax=Vigna unguiculata TaxID=3917 RepID=A0A4D6NB88_VIGUN|nr:hypothetical protein DEO72_LG10g2326 [Vigna unguiculata]